MQLSQGGDLVGFHAGAEKTGRFSQLGQPSRFNLAGAIVPRPFIYFNFRPIWTHTASMELAGDIDLFFRQYDMEYAAMFSDDIVQKRVMQEYLFKGGYRRYQGGPYQRGAEKRFGWRSRSRG